MGCCLLGKSITDPRSSSSKISFFFSNSSESSGKGIDFLSEKLKLARASFFENRQRNVRIE